MTELGKWIDDQLERSERSIDDLAKSMGIDVGTLGDIINGRIKRPPDARLSAMARFFGVSVETIRKLISGVRLDQGADVKSGDQSPNSEGKKQMNQAFVMDSPVELVACLDGHGVGEGLKQITLIPSGYVQSKAGNMLMDERAYRDVLANFNAHRTEVPIDYEHQTLGGEYASPSGLAPASGWIRQIYFDKTKGLMGLVEWTERGKEMILAGEYRYLSPTVVVRKSDKRPVELHSAALTNKPAIVGMERLAAKEHFKEAESMADEPGNDQEAQEAPDKLLGQIVELLKGRGVKIPDDVTREAVLEHLIRMLGGKVDKKPDAEIGDEQVASKVRSVLGLPDNADADAVALALSVRGNENAEVVGLRAEKIERDIDARLEVYIASNVINPNNKEQVASARRLCASDPNLFESIMANAAPYVAPGCTTATRHGSTNRAAAIRSAQREWNGDDSLQKQTSQEAYCNLALRDSGFDGLTDSEFASFSIQKAE